MTAADAQPVRYTFRRRHRLSGMREFNAVHRDGIRKPRGPLIVIGRPNTLPHCRLGLSVSRRVGTAAKRHAIKRRLREAFRLLQPTMPAGYDLLLIVRPHDTLPLDLYQAHLRSAWIAIDKTARRQTTNDQHQSDRAEP